jgi:hypothetical protein
MRRGRVRGVTPDAVIRSVVPGDTRNATAASLPAAQITAADSDTYLNAGCRENLSDPGYGGSWDVNQRAGCSVQPRNGGARSGCLPARDDGDWTVTRGGSVVVNSSADPPIVRETCGSRATRRQ